MATECYAMVRGSAIRVTGLGKLGQLTDPIQFATSKSVVRVTINEVAEQAGNEMLRSEEDEPRLYFSRSGQMIRHTVDIEFLRTDPGVLSLVAGVPLAMNAAGDIVGFDSDTKRPAASFALEVWSKLAGQVCADGRRQWGYTLLPFLKGGYLTGFTFQNGLVSFSLINAQTRRASRWGVGPYDLEGVHERLIETVSRNSSFTSFITPAAPPEEMDGIQTMTDILDNGNAADPMPIPDAPEMVDGEFVDTSAWIIDGGRAL